MPKKSALRIAIVAASAPPLGSGGVASAHYNLFLALKKQGFSVKLFTFFDNGLRKGRESGIERHGAPIWAVNLIYFLAQLPFRLVSPKQKAYQTGVILRSSVGAVKMGHAIARFEPQIVILSDHGAPGLFVPKNKLQKFILISHHNPARFAKQPLLGSYSKMDARIAIKLENQVLKKVDHVICPSRYMMSWFDSTYSYTGPVTVIPNLVEPTLLEKIAPKDFRKKLSLSKTTKLIYLPSAGTRVKGSKFLLPIIEGLVTHSEDDIGFYVPGHFDAMMKNELARSKYAKKLYMPGQVEYETHIANMMACDIGITPAIMENFSMAIIEAAYFGVPMLAFRLGGNSDIIKDGRNGYLVPAFRVDKIIHVALRLLRSPYLKDFKRRTKAYTRGTFNNLSLVTRYIQVMGINSNRK